MSLDLGAVVARVIVEDTEFQRTIRRDIMIMRDFGAQAGGSAAETARLDEALAAVGASASTASTALGRTGKSATATATAEQRAAAAAERQAAALAAVTETSAAYVGASAKTQQAALRDLAAQERLTAARAEAGSAEAAQAASTARLAGAQASAIGTSERLAAAQRATVGANNAAAASAKTASGAWAGVLRTAGQLGIVVGVLGALKLGLDVTKQSNEFTRAMVQVQTNADVTASEVHKATGQLLDMAGPAAAAPADLALAWYHAKSVGLDYAQSLETTRIAAEGARVGNANLEETMNALTSTVASGIPGVSDMSSAMGQLIAIVGAGDMKLSDLNAALGSGILSVVKGYGLSLTDVGAALATFGDNNIRGAEAATMLRMAVQAMAVPMKGGLDVLTSLGLSAVQLRDDMQKGGLNLALHDLKAHLDASGVSATQVGAILTEVFGKRAGPGLAVLMGQMDRFDTKFQVLRDSGASFADKWTATTQTASFALASLGHEAESLGIELMTKLGPSIAAAARWLGTSVPHAISVLAHILGPLIHMVGGALVFAWHALLAVLGPVATALGSVGHFLADNADAVRDVTGLVLGLWIAYKGYMIAVAAYRAITVALAAYRLEMVAVNTGAAAFGNNLRLFAAAGGPAALAVTAAAAAVGYLGFKLSAWLESGKSSIQVLGALKAQTDGWRDALVASNGVLTDNIRLSIGKELQDSGLAGKAAAAGISLRDLTDAITGSDAAERRLIATWKASGKPSEDTLFSLNVLHGQYGKTAAGAKVLTDSTKDVASAQRLSATAADAAGAAQRRTAAAALAAKSALHWVVTTSGNLVQTTGDVAKASDKATAALNAQTNASRALKLAEDLLNGVNQSAEQAADALTISLGGLWQKTSLATGANGKLSTSLRQNTVAGATNRQMLLGIIQAAQTQAQTLADQKSKTESYGQALRDGNAQLSTNEARIRAAAVAAGFNAGEVDKMIASLGEVSKIDAHPKVSLNDAASRPLSDIRGSLAALNGQVYTATVQITEAIHTVPGGARQYKAAGGLVHAAARGFGPAGLVVGPGGPTADQAGLFALSNREYVSTAASVARNMAALEAGNRGATLVAVDGFARKLQASAARASVPAVTSAPLPAPSGAGFDLSPLTARLEAIEAAVRQTPDEFAAAGAGLYDRAGDAQGKALARVLRRPLSSGLS